ncbi:MAG TPA: hypothetical protein VK071_06980 [Tissierellales bacterium]|nr:hypothetical protein [Tissierellales bacterium]
MFNKDELKIIEGGKEQRDKYIERVDVLEKVKELNTLAGTEYMITNQVAEFYEVDRKAINKVFTRNRIELIEDGVKTGYGKKLMNEIGLGDKMSPTETNSGGFLIKDTLISYTKNTLYPKRAVLRIGMLLRDSEVAKEVRTLLLNVYHDAEQGKENVIENINKELNLEQQLIIDKASAEYEGDWNEVSIINAKLFNLKNKRIKELETENKNLVTTATTIKDSRQIINILIRNIAVRNFNNNFGMAWSEFYRKVNYQLGINLKAREGKKSHLDKASQKELQEIERIARAWATKLGLEVDRLLELK